MVSVLEGFHCTAITVHLQCPTYTDSGAGSPVEFNETEAVCYLFTLGEVAQVPSACLETTGCC